MRSRRSFPFSFSTSILVPALALCVIDIASCSSNGGRPDSGGFNKGTGGTQDTGGSAGASSTAGSGTQQGSGGNDLFTTTDTPDAAGQCEEDKSAYCGDGIVNQTSEECDDGNARPGDGCTGQCTKEPFFDCPPKGGACTSTIKCGDGVRTPGEACDDGNTKDGDGCAADCSAVEPGWFCPTAGQACQQSTGECGDSRVQPGETCDDGNTKDGDGCSKLCAVEAGWRCTAPGQPCRKVPVCGNGSLEAGEECDDSNAKSDDGCSSTCHVEPGYLCATPGQACKKTVCGDGVREGAECCDDGNVLSFDGCTPDCRCEPVCPASGACESKCGNGIVEGSEECDDGNTASKDGCSETCKVEAGFKCSTDCETTADGQCILTVPAVFRDFNANDSKNGHPDFEPTKNNQDAITGLVEDSWDSDKKPVQTSKATAAVAFMHGSDKFKMWYRSPSELKGSLASEPIAGKIILYDDGKSNFVNRWGANGEQWVGYPQGKTQVGAAVVTYPSPQWCSDTPASCDADACVTPTFATPVVPADVTWECIAPCAASFASYACYAAVKKYDGNPLFFPIDPPTKGIQDDTRLEAGVPEQYGWNGWPAEVDVATKALGLTVAKPVKTATAPFPSAAHNFHFTTEVKWWFRFVAGTSMKLNFTGDDDVWVFVNGKLAVDLGGWHPPLDGSVTIDNTTAKTYDLKDGGVYQIGIFHAERMTTGSTFKLTLSGFALRPSKCVETCGDGTVTVSEECDNGAANSDEACGACRTDCTFGPRCGDGIVQADCGEACDDGLNVGGYNQCGEGCKPAERCGDGIVQSDYGEQCDQGEKNGQDGSSCTKDCGVPAFCGDGVVQATEECDNGINDNAYGGCSSDCHYGPRCGDGVVQSEFGETCDLGDKNKDDEYGGCTTHCVAGPHCGDGVVQGQEQCDPGTDPGVKPTTSVSATKTKGGCTAKNSTCSDTCRAVPVIPH